MDQKKDWYGTLVIANNNSVYVPEMMTFLYSFKFAGGSQIQIISDEEFSRGDVLQILSVNPEKNVISCKKVNDAHGIDRIPILVCVVSKIGVSSESNYLFEGTGADVLLVSSSNYRGENKFYALAVLLRSNRGVVRGKDEVTGTVQEWIFSVEQKVWK